jgi:hypothetical protein
VALSSILQEAPGQFNGSRLSAVEKFVTTIDKLPEPYPAAETVYLSRNCLTTLSGIEQFHAVKVLSFADNLLQNFSELSTLANACPTLVAASFTGNPMASLPNYRSHVISLLPNLQSLDGITISKQERQSSTSLLQQEAACMALMLSNACLVHKLVSNAP